MQSGFSVPLLERSGCFKAVQRQGSAAGVCTCEPMCFSLVSDLSRKWREGSLKPFFWGGGDNSYLQSSADITCMFLLSLTC